MKRKIIVSIILCLLFSFTASAEEASDSNFLKEQAEQFGVGDLENYLPEENREYFEENEIKPDQNEWINNFSIGRVFGDLWTAVTKKTKAPFATGGLILAIVLLNGLLSTMDNSISSGTAGFAMAAASAAVITGPLLSVIGTAVNVMQSVSVFMTAFVPVFAVVVAASGQAATSVSMSGLLLGASQVVEIVANHFVVPLMCGYLSVNIASSVSPLLAKSSIAESLKKISFWVMSLMTTVFLGVLSIQTTISASGDSLTMRTTRFIIGSSVPVAGTVLSEALTTVTASLGVLKTSVAIYGVVACAVLFLPLLLELLLWRLVLNITSAISGILSADGMVKLLKSADDSLAVLCGIILLTGALFIISLTVVVSVGKSV